MDKDTATIRIRELSETDNAFMAVVSFNSGPEYSITVRDPFTEEQEQELEWYFEEHLRFPFTKKVRADEAAQSITSYGEALFKQVFQGNPEINFPYMSAVQNGLDKAHIEIAGSPKFHALHWEALKDPAFKNPLALQATMVRQNLEPLTVQTEVQPSPTINLLIVTARPLGNHDVGYRTISRPLVEVLHHAHLPVQIDILRPGTYRALENHLLETTGEHGKGYYHVIHFDTHGGVVNNKAFLFFESERDSEHVSVKAKELASLLRNYQIPIVILNACQSGKQVGATESSLGSHLMQAGVQLVLAMGYSVTVSAAELLMQTLYKHLFVEDDVSIAIRHARTELYNHKERRALFNELIDLEDWLLPVVYQNQPPTLHVREFTPEESKAYHKHLAELEHTAPTEPTYGFVGRDLDILQVEKRLLTKRNILLVRGMGGAGKTTLLRHLGAWWRTTGLVNEVFYFGYDKCAWTSQQIMVEIAQKLLDPISYQRDFQSRSLDAQQTILAERLCAEHHLLILDNLESITSANFDMQHTLSREEQKDLLRFISALTNGHTLVLLGSRSSEDWLAKGTFDDNVHTLNGLDPEAASMLADHILEKHDVSKYRENDDLQHLLNLQDGFPLALEVLLPDLIHTTPEDILSALQTGDMKLDIEEGKQQGKDIFEQKTESILRCIEYSYSNLAPEAQQLLLCLAPFTFVFFLNVRDKYIAQLKQQPLLASLPFDRFDKVLQEAANWGLLSPDPNHPHFLRLQPSLSYFLRTRLHNLAQTMVRTAIEKAFRAHYAQFGQGLVNDLLASTDPKKQHVGLLATSLEYENLVTTLNLTLASQESIADVYDALLWYFDGTHSQRRGLELFQVVAERLAAYPAAKLAGSSGDELVNLTGTIATWHLRLVQSEEAEESYQKILEQVNRFLDEETRSDLQAKILYQLGIVAQQQQQLKRAEQHYQQALHIYIKSNKRYEQAAVYHQLAMVALMHQYWEQAKQYEQQALRIFVEFNDHHSQAEVYHQLGMVAQGQRQWEQAWQYYQRALRIYKKYNDRYSQAQTYGQLALLAQVQHQSELAEQYYEQMLIIYIESGNRYEQARIYHNLGVVVQEQQQWGQARDHFLRALEIFLEYNDAYSRDIVVRSLARLWRESGDARIPAMVAERFGIEVSEVEEVLREVLEKGGAGEKANGNEG